MNVGTYQNTGKPAENEGCHVGSFARQRRESAGFIRAEDVKVIVIAFIVVTLLGMLKSDKNGYYTYGPTHYYNLGGTWYLNYYVTSEPQIERRF